MRDMYEFRCDTTRLWQAGGSVSNHMEVVSDVLEEILNRREATIRSENERLRDALRWAMTYVDADHSRGANNPVELGIAEAIRAELANSAFSEADNA